jgi:hypothetical protein
MTPALALVALVGLAGAALAARALVVAAAPDEWLVQVRGGRVVAAGVGLLAVRWPGDVVVRFPSAVQRVRFQAEVTDADLLPVHLEAYVLWAVDPADPSTALRALGLGAVAGRGHLLGKPQHHAFQQAFAALALRHAGRFRLAELLRDPAPLVAAIRADAEAQLRALGGVVLDVQPLAVRPAAATVAASLAAPREEEARRDAERARAESRRAEDQLADERERARQAAALASELALEAARERVESARRESAERALAAETALAQRRAEAEATRMRTLTAAEADKPPAVREAELARLRIQSTAEAFGRLPLKEARWFSADAPLDALRRLLGPDA